MLKELIMRTSLVRRALGGIVLGILTHSIATTASADEFETRTPYYEDDAWYDVSEWLDGNDYNPTDETIGRWDDETYDAETAGSDSDNDADQGYTQNKHSNNNDWFYDNFDNRKSSVYSGPNRENVYSYRWDYFDYDRDGYYDAVTSLYDTNNDGSYDQFKYYAFSSSGADGEQQSRKTQGQETIDSSSDPGKRGFSL
jgi:hypothetical protein